MRCKESANWQRDEKFGVKSYEYHLGETIKVGDVEIFVQGVKGSKNGTPKVRLVIRAPKTVKIESKGEV